MRAEHDRHAARVIKPTSKPHERARRAKLQGERRMFIDWADVCILNRSPGGLLDNFFNENLAANVDTSTKPWTFKKLNDVDLGISPAVLEQFMYAAEIRSAFFPNGPVPQVQFSVTPEALEPTAESMTLDIDGVSIAYAQGEQPAPSGVTWPGAAGFGRITIAPADPAVENSVKRDGSWGGSGCSTRRRSRTPMSAPGSG
ncbi:MAG: hypothetical protein HC937_03090 [Aquincola sp.]|nr:hypothetical protein [Aquincola sp.]